MKNINIKTVIQYSLSFVFALALLWYVFKDIDLYAMLGRLKDIDFTWVILSVVLSLLSHGARAYRWNLLIYTTGYKPSAGRTLLALMVGYFSNLLMPRMGEVSRCAVLKKTDDVPVTTSLGTVVAERIIDLFSLLLLLGITFLVEFNRLSSFFTGMFESKATQLGGSLLLVYIVGGIFLVLIIIAYVIATKYKERIRRNALYLKIRHFLRQMVAGLISIKNLDKQAPFWIATFVIWFMYYMMSYVVFFALPETSGLGIWAGMAILVMGGLGMAAPVQGGIGTFHAMVSGVLILYGIKEADGVLFATILHTSQTLFVLLFGGASLLISMLVSKRNSSENTAYEHSA